MFDGLKIIELGNLISAPYCAKLFAHLGAEVIKVEKPDTGDEARHHGPFQNDIPHPEKSGLFLSLNTNKLGITLNMNKPQGIVLAKKLVSISDAVVENFSPRVMANWGLDYDNLKKYTDSIHPEELRIQIYNYFLLNS